MSRPSNTPWIIEAIVAVFLLVGGLIFAFSIVPPMVSWSDKAEPVGQLDESSPPSSHPICEADQAPQTRLAMVRREVPKIIIEVDDGDTVILHWSLADDETVRLLGADTAELAHPEMGWMEAQPFGEAGRDFMAAALEAAETVEIVRGPCADRYGRTLGYLRLDGQNYPAAVVASRLAYQTIEKYGAQGFYLEADEVIEAAIVADRQGPLPFENPSSHRAKMRAKATAQP